jgi:CheY-like chemotaxis protein
MKRILLVEDDPSIRESLADLLRGVGYVVDEARNGLEGLDRAAERRPDLILLDLMMPAMDGWQFREAQRGDALLHDVPVIITSAFASFEEETTMGEVAARFAKPYDVMALLEAIQRVAPGGEPEPHPQGAG